MIHHTMNKGLKYRKLFNLFYNTVSQDTDFQTHVSQRICQVNIIGAFFLKQTTCHILTSDS